MIRPILRVRLRLARLVAAPAFALLASGAPAEPALDFEMKRTDATIAAGPYAPDWTSLKRHTDPEWFRDAKLGIYTHWGPISLASRDGPESAQWYGRHMYVPGNASYLFHQRNFGDPSRVGYKDLIPRFTAERFDAEAWADLFACAGAKFAGPVAVHHDNFAMWDSKITRWNSVGMGPRRDIAGELAKAIRARGMKFIATFHHGYAWRYFEPAFAFDAADPQWADLYSEPHAPNAPPTKLFQDRWIAKVSEVLHRYEPDLIWFDFELDTVITPEYQRRMFALAYNWAEQHRPEFAVVHKHRSIHQHTGIIDFERGREDRLVPYPWLTDTTVGQWFHQEAARFKSPNELVDIFVDIVSKNGCMLLNVGPHADGSFPDQARRVLTALGDWIEVHGEAIFSTQPWQLFGEGPTRQVKGGGFSERADQGFQPGDVRFTTRGDALYAIGLEWPEGVTIAIRSLARPAGAIERVSLLGSSAPLPWQQTADALVVTLPAERPSELAFALKITGPSLKPAFAVRTETTIGIEPWDKAVVLRPANARLADSSLRVETKGGREVVTGWSDAPMPVAWGLHYREAGTHEVSVRIHALAGPVEFTVTFHKATLPGTAPQATGPSDFVTVELGRVAVPGGVPLELVLRPVSPANWRGVSLEAVFLNDVN
ncbi:MAG: alpha-L-fucosidase [Verrucomicrobia bacterium]|nr:alpha-L-fucosidase [Verrucomicrobiota bacterium]